MNHKNTKFIFLNYYLKKEDEIQSVFVERFMKRPEK